MKDNNNQNLLNVKSMIVDFIKSDSTKKSPFIIRQKFQKQFSRSLIKKAVNELVSTGGLAYTNHYGSNYLELSFNKEFYISEKIVLCPPNINYKRKNNEILIKINQGLAFGNGGHPSTRLCLKAIEYVFNTLNFFKNKNVDALDIGTGSGILSIASILFGAKNALAIDNDNIAIYEASENVKQNGLENCIQLQKCLIDSVSKQYQLILANLRIPTLIEIASKIKQIIDTDGIIIVSGIKKYEIQSLLNEYCKYNFKKIYQEDEFEWSMLILST